MKTTNKTIKWAYFPIVFCSTAVLSSQLIAEEDFVETDRANYEYVGGTTRFSIGVDTEFDGTAELSHVISEDKNSATIADVWAGFDASGDDKGVKAGGARINHNWVSRDSSGRAKHVNKVFGAYDRNEAGHDKATIGYGQESNGGFWEGYVGKSINEGEVVGQTSDKKDIFEKAYDYTVGANAGTFMPGAGIRVRAGAEYAWGEDNGEDDGATQTTLSAGIDKYFHDTPHSVSLDVAASKKEGGYNTDTETQTRANLSYNYEFGRNGIYTDGKTTKRVRVEIPGTPAVPARVEKRATKVPYKVARQVRQTRPVHAQACNVVRTTATLGCEYFFRENSHVLVPAAQHRLKQIANQIRRSNHQGNIMITGHACGTHGNICSGNNASHLAKRRAEMVKNYLIRHGFPANRLITRGVASNQNIVNIAFAGSNVQRQACGHKTTYKTVYDTKYRTEYKNVVVAPGRPATPGSVTWRTEVVDTQPTWVTRALHSTINYNRDVDTYLTVDNEVTTNPRPGNNAPVANDDRVMTEYNQSIKINVLNNDNDSDGDTLTITNVSKTLHGGSVMISNGQIMYTPKSGFVGTDQFTYTISDGKGGSATATVYVTVKGTKPQPMDPIKAVNDSAMTKSGKSVTIDVLRNDSGKSIAIIYVGKPANGTASISGGKVVYTPNAGFVGTETIKYTIKDANGKTATAYITVNVMKMSNTVKAVNDTAHVTYGNSVTINAISNDSDTLGRNLRITRLVTQPIHGTAKIVNGQIVYTPSKSITLKDRFTYEISDGMGNIAQAQIDVYVKAASLKPQGKTVANNDTYTIWKNTATTINPLTNDYDPEGDKLNITYVGMPVNGSIRQTGNQLTYTPKAGFYGKEVISYSIEDAHGNGASATITINVQSGKY